MNFDDFKNMTVREAEEELRRMAIEKKIDELLQDKELMAKERERVENNNVLEEIYDQLRSLFRILKSVFEGKTCFDRSFLDERKNYLNWLNKSAKYAKNENEFSLLVKTIEIFFNSMSLSFFGRKVYYDAYWLQMAGMSLSKYLRIGIELPDSERLCLRGFMGLGTEYVW